MIILVNESRLWTGATRQDAIDVIRELRRRGVLCWLGWHGIPEEPDTHPERLVGADVWRDACNTVMGQK